MDDLFNRISQLERGVGKMFQAPTVPVYDMTPPPPPPPPTTTTIVSISAYIYAVNSPTDQCIIKVCADDAGGTVPGTVLGSLTVPGINGGGWSTPAPPSPAITLSIGSLFWLLFDRTGAYSTVHRYAIDLGNSSGQGVAGLANPFVGAGFQWTGVDSFGVADGIWYTYTANKLATRVVFDDGNSWDNGFGAGSAFAFGRGNSNSLRGASKYTVP